MSEVDPFLLELLAKQKEEEQAVDPELAALLQKQQQQEEPKGSALSRFVKGFKGGFGDVAYGAGNMAGMVDDERLAQHKEKYSDEAGWADNIGDFAGETLALAPLGLVGKGAQLLHKGVKAARTGKKLSNARLTRAVKNAERSVKQADEVSDAAAKYATTTKKVADSKLTQQMGEQVRQKTQDEAAKALNLAMQKKQAAAGARVALEQAKAAGRKRVGNTAAQLGMAPAEMALKAAGGKTAQAAGAGAIMADPGERGMGALAGAGAGLGVGALGKSIMPATKGTHWALDKAYDRIPMDYMKRRKVHAGRRLAKDIIEAGPRTKKAQELLKKGGPALRRSVGAAAGGS